MRSDNCREQIFGPKTGEQKKAYVQAWLQEQGVKAAPPAGGRDDRGGRAGAGLRT